MVQRRCDREAAGRCRCAGLRRRSTLDRDRARRPQRAPKRRRLAGRSMTRVRIVDAFGGGQPGRLISTDEIYRGFYELVCESVPLLLAWASKAKSTAADAP